MSELVLCHFLGSWCPRVPGAHSWLGLLVLRKCFGLVHNILPHDIMRIRHLTLILSLLSSAKFRRRAYRRSYCWPCRGKPELGTATRMRYTLFSLLNLMRVPDLTDSM